MNTNCPACQLEVRIDTSRLPPGRSHQAACPRCRHVFPIAAEAPAPPPPPPAAVSPPPAGDAAAEAWLRRELERLRMQLKEEIVRDVLREVLGPGAAGQPQPTGDPGARSATSLEALIVADEGPSRQAACAGLQALGYTVEMASDLRAAATSLATGRQAVVVVERVLAGDEQAGARVIAAINGLPATRRRDLFVAYLSADGATGDPGLAFAHGVNMTVNRADAPRFADLIRDGIAERDEMYRVFRDVSEGSGDLR